MWNGPARGEIGLLHTRPWEGTFFAEFLYKYALDTPIAFGMDRGDNPRMIERDQLVRLMSLYAPCDLIKIGITRATAESVDPCPILEVDSEPSFFLLNLMYRP